VVIDINTINLLQYPDHARQEKIGAIVSIPITQEEQEIIREVRAFIKKEATPELLQEAHEMEYIYGGPEGRKFTKKFAANGWLALPKIWRKRYAHQ